MASTIIICTSYWWEVNWVQLMAWHQIGDKPFSVPVKTQVLWSHIQSSAVIPRSKIVRYHINNYMNWGRISIRSWIHKRHPIPRPLWGVFCDFCEKIDRVITALHCTIMWPSHGWNELTHPPLVWHICVHHWFSIGSDNGLSPVRHQAITFNQCWFIVN